MKQKKLIAEFQLDQQQFSLYLIEYEFILELKRHFRATRTSPKQNAWLAFADQADSILQEVVQQLDARAAKAGLTV